MFIRNENLFESLDLGDGTGAVVHKENEKVIFMNVTAWLIWEWCKCPKSISDILNCFREHTDADVNKDFDEREVVQFIGNMCKEGLIIND